MYSSGTLSEPAAPAKLASIQCPRHYSRVRVQKTKGYRVVSHHPCTHFPNPPKVIMHHTTTTKSSAHTHPKADMRRPFTHHPPAKEEDTRRPPSNGTMMHYSLERRTPGQHTPNRSPPRGARTHQETGRTLPHVMQGPLERAHASCMPSKEPTAQPMGYPKNDAEGPPEGSDWSVGRSGHVFSSVVLSASVQGSSQGAQGLPVLLLQARICTGNSISLSPQWRQWGSRDTIHAGQNLPVKEFRYLRTVSVTAAVYQAFPLLHHRRAPCEQLAPGRCQGIYVSFN